MKTFRSTINLRHRQAFIRTGERPGSCGDWTSLSGATPRDYAPARVRAECHDAAGWQIGDGELPSAEFAPRRMKNHAIGREFAALCMRRRPGSVIEGAKNPPGGSGGFPVMRLFHAMDVASEAFDNPLFQARNIRLTDSQVVGHLFLRMFDAV